MDYKEVANRIINGYYEDRFDVIATLESDFAKIITITDGYMITDYYWRDGERETFRERI